MKKARMIGNYIEHRIKNGGLDPSIVAEHIGITEEQLNQFCRGRLLLSFNQLVKLAELFNIAVGQILCGDLEEYDNSFSDQFDNPENREIILDIIDNYLDIIESINMLEELIDETNTD